MDLDELLDVMNAAELLIVIRDEAHLSSQDVRFATRDTFALACASAASRQLRIDEAATRLQKLLRVKDSVSG